MRGYRFARRFAVDVPYAGKMMPEYVFVDGFIQYLYNIRQNAAYDKGRVDRYLDAFKGQKVVVAMGGTDDRGGRQPCGGFRHSLPHFEVMGRTG